MKKKIIAWALTGALVIGSLTPTFAADSTATKNNSVENKKTDYNELSRCWWRQSAESDAAYNTIYIMTESLLLWSCRRLGLHPLFPKLFGKIHLSVGKGKLFF